MRESVLHKLFTAAVMSSALILSACSGGGASGSAATTAATGAAKAAKIFLSTSSASVKSDNNLLNPAIITATVADSNNIAVSGATVTFASGTGLLGVSSGTSDATGKVTISFSSGTGATNKTNRTEIITATILGTQVTTQIPIQVTGSSLTLVPSSTTVQVGGTVSLIATAKDAAPSGVAAQSLRFSIPGGNGSLTGGTVGTGTTTSQTVAAATSGASTAVTFTPAAAGSVVVTVDWLDASGNATLSASTTITVTSVGVSYAVTTPSSNPATLVLGASQIFAVSVPSSISGTTVSSVRFATSLGTWSNGSKVNTVVPIANSTGETLTAGASSGIATVQIDALDAANDVLATLYRTVTMNAAATSAAGISLQPSVSTVAPSTVGTAGTTNSVTLTAIVRDAGNNTVSNAPVLFELLNPTGSGEFITPILVTTDRNGQAVSTFTAGTASTVGGLQVQASVVGAAPAVSNMKVINVGGTGVSVSLGYATVISPDATNTDYLLPVSVLVVDSSGGAVSNVKVSLSAFPKTYSTGSRDKTCTTTITGTFPNEDINENDILDPGEDTNGDGLITPAHSTAGSLPATVTTDSSGSATFTLTYQKQYAGWIQARIRAKVTVSGTESTNTLLFNLPISSADASITPCPAPIGGISPFGP